MTTPWTATVTLHWRPTPRAYEARTSLLSSLEDQKRLRAFHVQDEVGHALLEDDAELGIGVTYFSVAFANDLPEGAGLPSLIDSVLDVVKPRISSVTARFQHLCPLPAASDFETAKANAARATLGALTSSLNITDTAILFDGLADAGVSYQAEFGIVNESEAATRLTQTMGRIESREEPTFTHVEWVKRGLPSIGLYVESRWRNTSALSSTTTEALYTQAKICREEANKLVDVLLEQVSGIEQS